jgi:hypothetical protein
VVGQRQLWLPQRLQRLAERVERFDLQASVTDLPADLQCLVQGADRRAWLAEFEQRGWADAVPLVIAYALRDRIWEEWIASQLRQVGQGSTLQEVNSPPCSTRPPARGCCCSGSRSALRTPVASGSR